jgi:phosphoribosyl-AMP cyclohydrolase
MLTRFRSGSPASCLVPSPSEYYFCRDHFRFSNPRFLKGRRTAAAIADAVTGEVLMLAYMNQVSYDETVATGRAVYFSRSRNKLWRKGEESGNVQEVREIFVDCDADTILLKVHQIGGAACHEGYKAASFAGRPRA